MGALAHRPADSEEIQSIEEADKQAGAYRKDYAAPWRKIMMEPCGGLFF